MGHFFLQPHIIELSSLIKFDMLIDDDCKFNNSLESTIISNKYDSGTEYQWSRQNKALYH